jgi:SAM-dependent methyltransferase
MVHPSRDVWRRASRIRLAEVTAKQVSPTTPAILADDPKVDALARLLSRRFGTPGSTLVVGCGDGSEAALLGDLLGGQVAGIDIVEDFDPAARQRVELRTADAMDLPFAERSFDLVFSFHALEHIEKPNRAVAEMRRVVRPNGAVLIGTPNRQRAVGYLGSRDASLSEKFAWNVADWRARLAGRFRNELGAHAGFAREELLEMAKPHFRLVADETTAYYELLYAHRRRMIDLIERIGVSRFAYPAVYVSGRP